MALINYKGFNVLTVGLPGGEGVVIMPGINQISDDVFEKVNSHPLFGARVRDDKIEILESSDTKKTVAQMLAYIPRIFDTKLLRKIIKEDGREEVEKAAKAQLETIISPKKDEAKAVEHFK